MKRITLTLSDALACELMRIAATQHRKLADLCRGLIQERLSSPLLAAPAPAQVDANSCDSPLPLPSSPPATLSPLPATVNPVLYGDYIPETMSREAYLRLDANNREFVIRGEMNWPLKPKADVSLAPMPGQGGMV